MALFTEAQLRAYADLSIASSRHYTADAILKEEASALAKSLNFDVFLSHSLKDAKVILGIKKVLERKRLRVYVDWIEDPQLDRSKVSAETAAKLRERLKQSKSLIYAHSDNSPDSKWMPWELGFFDGHNGNILIFPIAQREGETFKGQEFIGLYPYIDQSGAEAIWVNKGNAPASALGKIDTPGRAFRPLNEWMQSRAGVSLR